MLKDVSVLIPFKSDNGPRDAIFKWVLDYYTQLMPEAEICIGTSKTELFLRSQAINDAAKKATREIFVIADADLVYDSEMLVKSINLLNKYSLVYPYHKIMYLSECNTQEILKSQPVWPLKISDRIFQLPYDPFGGVNVVTRKNFEVIGGFDERFVGWGGEDNAFFIAITTLFGPHLRLERNGYHLWHPTVGAKGNPNYKNNFLLAKKYLKANGNQEAIWELINKKNP